MRAGDRLGLARMLEMTGLVVVGYVLGSIPFSRLVGRRKGVDLRRTGSGVASVANVWHTLGWLPAVAALVGDLAKAAVPVGLVSRVLGPELAALTSVSVLLGHNWPIFARFNGGRGLLVVIGGMAVVAPRELVLALTLLVPAWFIRDTAPASAAAILVLVPASVVLGEPPGVIAACVAVAAIVFVRRATAPPRGAMTPRILMSRLIFDRPDPAKRWALDYLE